MLEPRTILITGGSSGIGEALALEYAAPDVRLILTGRNQERLESVAAACRARGAEVRVQVIDVKDRERMQDWLSALDDEWPIDLAFANAGVSGGTGGFKIEPYEQAREILGTNIDGVLNTIFPLIPRMQARGHGQIGIVSSLASFYSWPTAPAYAASKAGVRAYGEALRPSLARTGVRMSVICPGFVVSRMTDANRFRMPFIMSADKAARIVRRGLARDKARIVFPLVMYLGTRLLAALPLPLAARLVALMPAKG